MDESSLEAKLNELVKEVGGVVDPQYRRLATLAQEAHDSQKKLQQSVDSLQDSLNYQRI